MNGSTEQIGIILLNTGSPSTPEPDDIGAYLKEFLSDRNIIRIPRILWLPILYGIIARTRPKKTAPRYKMIWTEEGSPLLTISHKQCQLLNKRFSEAQLPFHAAVGMRYGDPSIQYAYQELKHRGCTKMLCFPLFPQNATCTIGSCKERFLQVIPRDEILGVIEGYADDPLYWKAIAHSIEDSWTWKPGSKLLFSFHSIPLSDAKAGDTYLHDTQLCTQRIAELLGLSADNWAIGYHSRFEDSRSWAGPSPKSVLKSWAEEGVTRIAMITPGFAADCLESLYDIALIEKQRFKELCASYDKQADVTYIPALNDRSDHIDLLYHEVLRATHRL